MQIEVQESPNCGPTDQFVYRELGPVRPVKALRIQEGAREVRMDVTGVAEGGIWVPAFGVKVADSGAGFAFLIFGGAWGIRLKPSGIRRDWDLQDKQQWGEPFKLYGSEDDIIYADF